MVSPRLNKTGGHRKRLSAIPNLNRLAEAPDWLARWSSEYWLRTSHCSFESRCAASRWRQQPFHQREARPVMARV
eukprot:scaffold135_cov249-Pinguiococcus_pyrenoidosus.AAC.24